MPPDLALLSTLIGSNYPCLELISMVPRVFEPLKFDCIIIDTSLYKKLAVHETALTYFIAYMQRGKKP